MINLQEEKEYKISTQDVYDIVSYAVDSADDGGFINTFVLERALYEYTVLDLFPDIRDKYQKKVASNPNLAWDDMLKDGLIDKLQDYSTDMHHIADVAAQWVSDYESYAHSIRGAADVIQNAMNAVSEYSLNNLEKAANNKALRDVTKIADKWGMNNGIEYPEKPIQLVKDDSDKKSLFTNK